ncbi:hypothetical protein ADL27_42825 [Streptomyces sp. NRRL F-6602]|nr:hypothetical protein ADL27_42825 [Streptomyces sp. NRRL F-6602]
MTAGALRVRGAAPRTGSPLVRRLADPAARSDGAAQHGGVEHLRCDHRGRQQPAHAELRREHEQVLRRLLLVAEQHTAHGRQRYGTGQLDLRLVVGGPPVRVVGAAGAGEPARHGRREQRAEPGRPRAGPRTAVPRRVVRHEQRVRPGQQVHVQGQHHPAAEEPVAGGGLAQVPHVRVLDAEEEAALRPVEAQEVGGPVGVPVPAQVPGGADTAGLQDAGQIGRPGQMAQPCDAPAAGLGHHGLTVAGSGTTGRTAHALCRTTRTTGRTARTTGRPLRHPPTHTVPLSSARTPSPHTSSTRAFRAAAPLAHPAHFARPHTSHSRTPPTRAVVRPLMPPPSRGGGPTSRRGAGR